jgi:hypothetical protein
MSNIKGDKNIVSHVDPNWDIQFLIYNSCFVWVWNLVSNIKGRA